MQLLRGDVDIDKITSLKVTSTTWKLYLEEAPEAFEVVAYDDSGIILILWIYIHIMYNVLLITHCVILGNKFSTLEGISLAWTVVNVGRTYGDEPLVM